VLEQFVRSSDSRKALEQVAGRPLKPSNRFLPESLHLFARQMPGRHGHFRPGLIHADPFLGGEPQRDRPCRRSVPARGTAR